VRKGLLQGVNRALRLALLAGATLLASASSAAAGELGFTLLHTNDEHSTLLPSPLSDYHPTLPSQARGGFARLAQAVAHVRAEKAAAGEPVLLVSAGDFLGGSAFAWLGLAGLTPELSLMMDIGYDVITIGNHEFDYGSAGLAGYLSRAGYPDASARTAIVASNTLAPPEHPLHDVGLQKTHITELDNGLRVGFFGIMGLHAQRVIVGAEPVVFTERFAAAREAVAALRAAGANVVVALSHSGVAEDTALARAVQGIDVIVGGHTHEALAEPLQVGSTLIAQTGALLENLGVLELAYSVQSGHVRLRNEVASQPYLLALDHRIPEHPAVAEMIGEHTDALNTLVGRLSGGRFSDVAATVLSSAHTVSSGPRLSESAFGNFITDAMRAAAEEALGEPVDFAFQANGMIRGSLVPGSQPHAPGHVALLDLLGLTALGSGPDGTPGYPMVSVYLTGAEIRRVLEISVLLGELMGNTHFLQASGLRMHYDPARAVLFTVPIKNIPVPTTQAVLRAERETGRPGQTVYMPLERDDQTLYQVVSDYYVAASLPQVGALLPSLGLVMKDRDGNPITAEEAVIHRDGRELKVWQAVAEFAAAQPRGADGVPRMPEYYWESAGRLIRTDAVPLLLYPFALLLALGALGTLPLMLRRRRRAAPATG
jgi:5'-nucleotidase / UDP-sugar diphosphatase